jgi:sterol desaturase/sphingolipid hydroxylase (fatty acid hydroxylase superfamily)
VKKLPRPFECVLNTPSHHRVHHGSNDVYLDKNYGGILIIWDRLFGSFIGEDERVRYGLTKNIRTFSPFKVAFHEYQAMWGDLKQARGFGDRVRILFKGPGWRPDAPNLSEVREG